MLLDNMDGKRGKKERPSDALATIRLADVHVFISDKMKMYVKNNLIAFKSDVSPGAARSLYWLTSVSGHIVRSDNLSPTGQPMPCPSGYSTDSIGWK